MIELFKKEKDCCGCTACMSICPNNAISMYENDRGFIMPQIDDRNCVECGLCMKVCDFKVFKPENNTPSAYAFRINNTNALMTSQSGGAAAAFAETIINLGGVVFGSELTKEFHVEHKMECDLKGIEKFKGSKYVQSDLKECFRELKECLDTGKKCLFTGTACQTHGLLRYLEMQKVDLSNLYTMDIICHGVPSSGVWKKYIQALQKKQNSKLISLKFRDKKFAGWHSHVEKYKFADGKILHSDAYANVFYNHVLFRDSCFNCKYTTTNRKSDLTVGDFWGIEKVTEDFNDNKGVSVIITGTEKGEQLLSKMKNIALIKQVPLESVLQPQLISPPKKGWRYNGFWMLYSKNSEKAINKFFFPSKLRKDMNMYLRKCNGFYCKIKAKIHKKR